jgi:hypothetical protein
MTRRTFLGTSAALAATACASPQQGAPSPTPSTTRSTEPAASAPMIAADQAAITPTPTPQPFPAGASTRTLLAGTASETTVGIRHSGVRGPAVVVLGGVHGNEPGGWLAADEVATWEPKAGSLIVIPRANVQAIAGFVRTTDEIGDLNRFYPGHLESPFLMERMAAAIMDLCREFRATLLLDMHESWAFYAEYPPASGTGALGQTITAGVGPLQTELPKRIAEAARPSATAREQFIVRDGTQFSRPPTTPSPGATNRGRSSLSAGVHCTGLTPVLVEMGQEHQPLDRRIALHLLVARITLELVGAS